MNTITLKLGPDQNKETRLAQKEITLMLGSTTGDNIHASLVHAARLLHEEKAGNILYINTVQTPWKIAESARKALPEPDERYFHEYYLHGDLDNCRAQPRLFFLNSEMGELHKEKEKVLKYCRENRVRTIIIKSWECAATDARVRDKLLYLLRGFNRGDRNPQFDYEKFHNTHPDTITTHDSFTIYDYFPATILIYAQERDDIELGAIRRGGFGRLMVMADQIVHIGKESEVRGQKSEVGESEIQIPISEINEEVGSEMEIHMAPVLIPTSDVARRTSDVPRMPLHMNGYSSDKPPARSAELHNDVIRK